MTLPPAAIDAGTLALATHLESGEMRPRILTILMLKAAGPHIAAAAWRDGYGQGRDDEAHDLPIRTAPHEAHATPERGGT